MSDNVERLIIAVTDQGSTRRVQSALAGLGATGQAATKTVTAGMTTTAAATRAVVPHVDYLRRALVAVTAVMGARKVIEYADSYINLQNRLRLVTAGQTELVAVTNQLEAISNRTRAPLAATGELYARLAAAAKTLGRAQEDVLGATETLNEAIILSGATTAEATGGMIQLAQGIASGVLRGDELRSVLEQLPAVADVIAAHLGVTRGRLRELGEQGAISAKQVMDALIGAREEIHGKFLKTIPTISQSFVVLGNNMMMWLGRLNESTGAFTAVSKSVLFLGQHIGILVGALTTLAVAAIPRAVMALKSLTIAMATNPVFLIGIAIGAATAAFIELQGSIEDVALVFEQPLMAAATFAGTVSGLFHGIINGSLEAWKLLPKAVGDMFIQTVNAVLVALQVMLNKLTEGVNAAIGMANRAANWVNEQTGRQIPLMTGFREDKSNPRIANPYAGAAEKFFSQPQKTLLSEFDAYLLGMQSKVQAFFNGVRKTRDQTINVRSKGAPGLGEGAAAAPNPIMGVRALEDLKRELALEKELVGYTGYERKVQEDLGRIKIEMARQRIDLQSQEAKNALVLAEQQVRELDTLKSKHEFLESVSTRSNEVATERALVGVYGAERTVIEEMARLKAELKRKNVNLNDAEVAAGLARTENIIRENEQLKIQMQMKERLLSWEKERALTAKFYGDLLRDRVVTEEQYNQGMREAGMGTNTLSGAVEGVLDPFEKIDASVSATSYAIGTELVGALDRASGAFADFAASGFRDMDSFREALANVFEDIGKMIIQMIIKMLILQAIQAALGGLGFGGTASPVVSGAGSQASLGALFAGRASGGPVYAGHPYLVGENGPEPFIPNVSGTIVPAGAGGGTPDVNVSIVNVKDPSEVVSVLGSAEGKKQILNVLQENRGLLKGLVS